MPFLQLFDFYCFLMTSRRRILVNQRLNYKTAKMDWFLQGFQAGRWELLVYTGSYLAFGYIRIPTERRYALHVVEFLRFLRFQTDMKASSRQFPSDDLSYQGTWSQC